MIPVRWQSLTAVNQFKVAPDGLWENKSPAFAADRVGHIIVYYLVLK